MISRRNIFRSAVLFGCVATGLAVADEALPTADKVLDRYIEVTGGKAAHEKVKSAVVVMNMTMPAQNMNLTVTTYIAQPRKMYVVTELPGGMGTIEEGASGDIAWSRSPMTGPRLKEGEEKEVSIRSTAIDKDLRWRDYYTKAEVLGVDTVDGKPCYKVQMTPKAGSAETRYYDKESGFMVKMTTITKNPMGEIPTDMKFSDYRKVDGILAPASMVASMNLSGAPQEMIMKVDSVKYNADIPAEKFKIPADIQALIDKKNGKPAETK